MTREKAQQWIESLVETMKDETSGKFPDPQYKDEVYGALDLANKSLKAWDKVVEEIQDEPQIMTETNKVLGIINKHLGEVEE